MRRAGGLALALALIAGEASACRQALALGLDVSGSVDAREYRLQRTGLARALGHPDVQEAILSDGAAPVRIAVYEWSGPRDQAMIVPWTEITDAGVLARVIGRVQSAPRAVLGPTTAIGPAMLYGFALLEEQPDCWRRTLDLSGDGVANTGLRPQTVQVPPQLPDVLVNGLVIASRNRVGGVLSTNAEELTAYFEANVIRGAGSFVEVAQGFNDYAEAMRRKLLRELEVLATSALEPDLR